MLASQSKGTVSSFFLYWIDSNVDIGESVEIDFEIVPSVAPRGFSRSAIYGDGSTTTFDNTFYHPYDMSVYHTYAIEWTPNNLRYSIDGDYVLEYDNAFDGL
jgi:beta-glucanase (GH16 family)